MEIYKLQQVTVLIVCIFAGILCAIVYDVFKAYRKSYPPSQVRTSVCDVMFWAVSALIVYIAIHLSNNAELRWYEAAGVISGYAVYTLYLSRYCRGIIAKFIKSAFAICRGFSKLWRIYHKIMHILISPFKRYACFWRTRVLFVFHTSFHTSKKHLCNLADKYKKTSKTHTSKIPEK